MPIALTTSAIKAVTRKSDWFQPRTVGDRVLDGYDIEASVKALVAAGGTVVQDTTDVANGLLVATIKEPSGTVLGLRQFPKG